MDFRAGLFAIKEYHKFKFDHIEGFVYLLFYQMLNNLVLMLLSFQLLLKKVDTIFN